MSHNIFEISENHLCCPWIWPEIFKGTAVSLRAGEKKTWGIHGRILNE